jgi:hypothetical protein
MTRGFSPLERRLLLALISDIRDREPDPHEWTMVEVPIKRLYERCYDLAPDKSYELQVRSQRQALRRALERLRKLDLVAALALAWVNVSDQVPWRWQGGGKRESRYGDGYPRWRYVSLTTAGVKTAELLEAEMLAVGAS